MAFDGYCSANAVESGWEEVGFAAGKKSGSGFKSGAGGGGGESNAA